MSSEVESAPVPTTSTINNSAAAFDTLPDLLFQTTGKDLSQHVAQSYLKHLSALDLTSIRLEPSALASEASQLRTELTNLCHDQHGTFLTVHSTTRDLAASFTSLDGSLETLLTALPDLESECRTFAASTREIQLSRSRASLVLEQHDKLLDVLTIPQLIDTCARNGHYAEALDLAAHASTLATRFSDIQAICDVAAEAEICVRTIRASLLMSLREPVKLPTLVKTTNLLRRMKALDESELALAFLTGRIANLNVSISAIEREGADQFEDAPRYLKRYVDVFREGLHEIVTQFSTIFLERPPSEASKPTNASTLESHNHLLGELTHHVLESLYRVLNFTLPHISDSSALNTLLSQLSYCGSAFARIGLDFRPMLPKLFEQAVLKGVSRTLDEGEAAFSNRLQNMQRSRKLPSLWLVTPEQASNPPMAPKPTASNLHVPPPLLSAYPPIALLANTHATTLNQLRLLSPANILPHVYELHCKSIANSSATLLAYAKGVVASEKTKARRTSIDGEDEQNRAVLAGAGLAITRSLSPFVRAGIVEGIFTKSFQDWVPAKTEAIISLEDAERLWENWLSELGLLETATASETPEDEIVS
ncbi:Dor1-domain-containing protein [Ceratobasidium sp. AG-I]|nr:Dor1-domain-containing protein [Ceratobasidium sp. AG-I]